MQNDLLSLQNLIITITWNMLRVVWKTEIWVFFIIIIIIIIYFFENKTEGVQLQGHTFLSWICIFPHNMISKHITIILVSFHFSYAD